MGSGKYGAFLLFTGAVSKLLELVCLRVGGLAGRMGPFNAVFANMINYMIDVPAVQHFSLFGLPLNDKVSVGCGGWRGMFCVCGRDCSICTYLYIFVRICTLS